MNIGRLVGRFFGALRPRLPARSVEDFVDSRPEGKAPITGITLHNSIMVTERIIQWLRVEVLVNAIVH